MSWVYSGDPGFSDKDQVRFQVGDTDGTDQQVSDEEIEWAITETASTRGAAAIIARAIAAKYARLTDMSVGDLRQSYSQRQEHYTELAERLERQEGLRSLNDMYAGGISESDKETQEEDTDRVSPNFKIGMHDNPGSSTDTEDVCTGS